MEVTCTLCETPDNQVPYEIIREHVQLIHGDMLYSSTPTALELKNAFIHLCVAINKVSDNTYRSQEHKEIVTEGIERVAAALLILIETNGVLEQ